MTERISPEEALARAGIELDALFKSGMRRLAAGVSLIATEIDGQKHGLVVTSVTSLTAEPPSLLVCINKTASAHAHIEQAGKFSVNVLSPDATEIAKVFSDPTRRAERFALGSWTTLSTGAPILGEALVAFDCVVGAAMPYASHTIFVGEVKAVRVHEENEQPLVYFNRDFHHILLAS